MATVSSAALVANGISHDFPQPGGRALVLDRVALTLNRGEFCLLMGESGSGKSTLMAVLSGLLPPSQGQVLVDGVDLWSLTEPQREEFRRRQFGFIFQGHHLFPALTAEQQLEIVLRWGDGMPHGEARRQARAMLAQLGLEQRRNRLAAQLSGGEKQRVAIGRALVKRPSFCFADEPTSALDSRNAHEVMRLLRSAAHEVGSTVFVITHDHRMAEYADRIFDLDDGRLSERPRASRSDSPPRPSPQPQPATCDSTADPVA